MVEDICRSAPVSGLVRFIVARSGPTPKYKKDLEFAL